MIFNASLFCSGQWTYLRTHIWFMYFGLALHFQISLQEREQFFSRKLKSE